MKLRNFAIFICLLVACPFIAASASAQSNDQQKDRQKNEDNQAPAVQGKFSVKLFEIKHRQPSSLRDSLVTLCSGAKGSEFMANNQLRTLTVRDFPENIAVIEDALKRLDVPEQSPVSLEFQIHLLSASMVAPAKTELPKNLEPVVNQLKATLKFTNYRYISSALNRASNGGRIESSGVTGSLFHTPGGVTNTPENPSFYNYSLSNVKLAQDASGKETVQIDLFKFGVSAPLRVNPGQTQYRDIGLITPLSLREGEMAVVGTANISGSDEAIIVIVSVKKLK
jgi:hypothetical protein